MKRYAIVSGNHITAEKVAAYLPSGYKVIGSGKVSDWSKTVEAGGRLDDSYVVIGGEDFHGWTLDGYVIPRLGSGNMWAKEIDLSHPVMLTVEAT